MLKKEFEEVAGYQVTNEDYYKIIEPLYMTTDCSKTEFVQMLNRKRFALPTKAEAEKQMKKQAETFARSGDVEDYFTLVDMLGTYAGRFYNVDPFGCLNEWAYISEHKHPYTGRTASIVANLGRLGSFSHELVLYQAK